MISLEGGYRGSSRRPPRQWRKGRLGEMNAVSIAGVKRKRDGEEKKEDSAVEAGEEFAGFNEVDEGSEDEDEGGGVVLPTSIGNLDAFAEANGVEDEDEKDDTHVTKKKRK